MIEITTTSKIGKVGHKIMNFAELVNISPQLILDFFKKDNRLVLNSECQELLEIQKKNKGICRHIVKMSLYRKHKNEELESAKYITESDDLCMGNQQTYYRLFRSDLRYGV